MKTFNITLWDKALATQGKQATVDKQLTLEEILAINSSEFEFCDIELNGCTIDATDLKTDNAAMVGKYIVEPLLNNTFKLPLLAYVCALADDLYAEWANDDVESTLSKNDVNLRTVKEWAETRLVLFSETDSTSLLNKLVDHRVEHIIKQIKQAVGTDIADFVQLTIDRSGITTGYNYDLNYMETQWKDNNRNMASALFKISPTDHDELFKTADQQLDQTV